MKQPLKALVAIFIFILSIITGSFLFVSDKVFAADYGAACDAQYANSTTSMRNACKLGGDHASETDFCTTQFPDVDSLGHEACEFGRKTALGQDATPPAKPNQSLNFTDAAAWCDSEYADATTSMREACKAATTREHVGDNNYCATVGEAGSLAFTACQAGQAKARAINTNADGTPAWQTTTGTSSPDSDKTCVIPYIGWAICPILLAASAGIDQSYDVVRSFLETPISIFTDARVQEVYGHILTYANAILGIIFLIIIYAELTGGLMSNYSVKKLLPKLILSAIIINIAFYICAAVVDLVNIVGAGIPDIFNTLSPSSDPALNNVAGGIANATDTGPEFESITRAVLSGGGIAAGAGVATVAITGTTWSAMLWSVVLFLIPIILGILVAILGILLALTLRSVAIVIFVIISPLAFCAMILPNTQKWFQKWWDTFFKMLLLYPIVALVFAGSALAGGIIINTASAQGNEAVKIIMLIAGSAATILPLIVVPGLLKGAATALGTLGAKVSGLTDKGYGSTRSITDRRMRETGTGQYYKNLSDTRKALQRGGVRPGKRREALRTMPKRTDWQKAYGYSAVGKIATEWQDNYSTLLANEVDGKSFKEQLDYYRDELVKASATKDISKVEVILTKTVLGKTAPGLVKLKQAIEDNHIGTGDDVFSNQFKGIIGANKGDFIKDAQIYQYAAFGANITDNVDLNVIALKDGEISIQSDKVLERMVGLTPERATTILNDTKSDLTNEQRAVLIRRGGTPPAQPRPSGPNPMQSGPNSPNRPNPPRNNPNP